MENVNNELTSSPVSTCTPESANYSEAPSTKPGILVQRRRELICLNFLFFSISHYVTHFYVSKQRK
jgi:hypothetical protein